MWISSFKAISWALNRGALVTQPFNFVQFLVVYAAPVTPVANGSGAAAAKPAAAAEPPTSTASEPSGQAPSETSKDSGSAATPAVADGGAAAGVRKGRLAEDAGGTSTMLRVWATKGACRCTCGGTSEPGSVCASGNNAPPAKHGCQHGLLPQAAPLRSPALSPVPDMHALVHSCAKNIPSVLSCRLCASPPTCAGLFLACMAQLLQYPLPGFLESFCLGERSPGARLLLVRCAAAVAAAWLRSQLAQLAAAPHRHKKLVVPKLICPAPLLLCPP